MAVALLRSARFYPVSESELHEFREDFLRGRAKLKLEPMTFRLADYRAFVERNRVSIEAFKKRQQTAFEAERERWTLLPPPPDPDATVAAPTASEETLGPGETAIRADVTSNVWRLSVTPGTTVAGGDPLLILESMKMEIAVNAPTGGTVTRILVTAGTLVSAGQLLAVLTS